MLSKNNKVATRHFNGATTNNLKSNVKSKISNEQEYISLRTKNLMRDISNVDIEDKIMEVAVACKLDNNIILFSGKAPLCNELKTTLVTILWKNEHFLYATQTKI